MVAVLFLLVGLKISGATGTEPTPFEVVSATGTDGLSRSPELPLTTQRPWPTETEATEEETRPVPTPSSTETFSRPPAEEFAYHVRNRDGRVCLLARFRADFTVFYRNRLGRQKVAVHLPKYPRVEGECADNGHNPSLRILWSDFSFSMSFSKATSEDKDEPDFWGVKSMKLIYDTSGPLFGDAADAGKKWAARPEEETWLRIPTNESYSCPSVEALQLYDDNNQKTVSVALTDVRIQPYNVVDGLFSPARRCDPEKAESASPETFRDETAPVAVGGTLAALTLVGVSGYAVYRTVTARRVDYSTME